MNPVATEIIRHGMGAYATRRLLPATSTPWATTEQGARVHAYQPTTPCCLPCPDDHNTVIFADASGTTSLTPRLGGQLWSSGQTRQADCTNTTSQEPPSSGPPLTGN